MKIEYRSTSIFGIDVEVYCNPVNCVGIMGGGLAAAFKRAYPENFNAYFKHCEDGLLEPGGVFVKPMEYYKHTGTTTPKYIFNVATKNHWRNPTRLEWVDIGINNIFSLCTTYNAKSVAIPMLGCGLGGLDWNTQVHPVFEKAFEKYANLDCRTVVLI